MASLVERALHGGARVTFKQKRGKLVATIEIDPEKMTAAELAFIDAQMVGFDVDLSKLWSDTKAEAKRVANKVTKALSKRKEKSK